MLKTALGFLLSFIFTILLVPLVIKLSKKLKMRQTILHYVDNHSAKEGTPTMGGIGMIIPIAVITLILTSSGQSLTLIAVLITVGYGIIGFLDDFIKIFFKQNKGLSPMQKILFQILLALIAAFFAYYSPYVGDKVFVPFTFSEISLGFFAVPLYVVIIIAYTNAVNLTDGLDGLASKMTLIYMLFNGIIIALIIYFFGDGQAFSEEYKNLIIFCAVVCGALIGFLCYNGYPAKIFMGDTGSLALGGAVASLAIFSKLSLSSPIIGIMYVLTCLSVIIQVMYYKKTKRRVFLMAPLHHHFERKGIHENQIVNAYSALTLAMGLLCVIVIIIVNQ